MAIDPRTGLPASGGYGGMQKPTQYFTPTNVSYSPHGIKPIPGQLPPSGGFNVSAGGPVQVPSYGTQYMNPPNQIGGIGGQSVDPGFFVRPPLQIPGGGVQGPGQVAGGGMRGNLASMLTPQQIAQFMRLIAMLSGGGGGIKPGVPQRSPMPIPYGPVY